MDYKKLSVAIKLCGSTPKVDQCPQCQYWASGDMNNCIPRVTSDAATAITDLLARAEAAEDRAEKAERERDAAIKELDGVSSVVGDLADFIDEQIHPIVPYNMYTDLMDNVYAITMWEKESEWRGKKEE